MVLESLKVLAVREPSSDPICPPTPEGIKAVQEWWTRWAACEEQLPAKVWTQNKPEAGIGEFPRRLRLTARSREHKYTARAYHRARSRRESGMDGSGHASISGCDTTEKGHEGERVWHPTVHG